MSDREAYAGLLMLAGIAFSSISWWLGRFDAMWVGLALAVAGILIGPTGERDWYCAACGQYLGKGDRSSTCERCGSNRVTDRDSGAGEAVRVNPGRRGR